MGYEVDVKNGMADDLDQSPGTFETGKEMVIIGHYKLISKTERCLLFRGIDKQPFTVPMKLPTKRSFNGRRYDMAWTVFYGRYSMHFCRIISAETGSVKDKNMRKIFKDRIEKEKTTKDGEITEVFLSGSFPVAISSRKRKSDE